MSNKAKSAFDAYKKRKNEKTDSNQTSSKGAANKAKSAFEAYQIRQYGKPKVDQDYINTFVSDYNKFASADKDSVYGTWKELDLGSRSNTVRVWLDLNKESLDENTHKDLSDAVDSITKFNNYGKEGWETYQTEKNNFAKAQEDRIKAEEEARKNESFWDKLGRWYSGGVTDTTLPLSTMPSVIHDMSQTTAEEAQLQALFSFNTDNYTDDQKDMFGRLYKEDIAAAAEYAKSIELGKAEEFATQNFWTGALHTAGSVLMSPITGMADFLHDLAEGAARGEITTKPASPYEYSQAGTQAISENLNEAGTLYEGIPIIGGKGWGDVYSIGTSIAQSALSAVTGGGLQATTTFFGSAAASGVDNALSRGATSDQAIAFGFVSGLAEAAAEYLPAEMLLGNAGKSFFKSVRNQMIAEGIEEGVTSLATNIADDIIVGKNSQFNKLVEAYMGNGMSREDAVKKAWVQTFEDVAFDALAGAVSGGISGAGFSTISNSINDRQVGKDIINKAEAAENFDSVAALKSLAYEMAGEKNTLPDKQLANTAGKINYMNLKARNVGKTHRLISNSITEQNATDIQKSLTEKGLNKKESTQITEYLLRASRGMPYSDAEEEQEKIEAKIAGDDRIIDVLRDVIGNPDSDVNARWGKLSSALQGGNQSTADTKTSVPVQETTPEVMKGEHKVSESGKTQYTNENGETEEVSIQKIVSTNGGIKVELDNGKTVNVKDLELSSDAEAMAYEMVTRMETNPETAQVIFEAVKASDATSAEELFLGVPTAYRYGKINYEAGLAKLSIPDAIKKLAFDLGKQDAMTSPHGEKKSAPKQTNKNNAKKVETKQYSKVIFEGFEYSEDSATDIQKASMKGVELLSKLVKSLELHVFASWEENGERYAIIDGVKSKAPNGYFKKGTNKIYIDINAGSKAEGSMLYTLGHEVTHFIAAWNKAGFKKLGDFLIKNFGDANVPLDRLIARKQEILIEGYKRDGKDLPSDNQLYMKAYEEVVAESMVSMFADPNAYEKLAELKQQNKQGWEKLKEAIKSVLDKLKSLLNVYKDKPASTEEARYVDKFSKDVYDKLQDLYLKAFVEADANYQAWVGGRDIAAFADAKTTDGENLFQYRAMEADEATYREMLVKWGGMSDTQVTNLFETIDKAMDIIKDNLEVLDYAWEADIDDRAFSPVQTYHP